MKENNNLIKKCEICLSQATNICYDCYAYFCESCYKMIHEKQANINHKKEKIDLFVPIDIKCFKHPKNIINLFCVEEKGN